MKKHQMNKKHMLSLPLGMESQKLCYLVKEWTEIFKIQLRNHDNKSSTQSYSRTPTCKKAQTIYI